MRLLQEKEFTDYGTGTVVGDDIFASRTYVPFYDQILKHPEEAAEEENLKAQIQYMSPREYYQHCAYDIFHTTVQKLINQREYDKAVNDDIKELIVDHKRKVFLPYINFAENTQEGLHRMYVAAQLFGWDHEFPVLVINYADTERAQREEQEKINLKIYNTIKKAVRQAVQYSYTDIKDFEENLQWFIDREFYDDESTKFTLSQLDDEINITVKGVTYSFLSDEINFKEKPKDDLDTVNWEPDDEIDALLKKYGIK